MSHGKTIKLNRPQTGNIAVMKIVTFGLPLLQLIFIAISYVISFVIFPVTFPPHILLIIFLILDVFLLSLRSYLIGFFTGSIFSSLLINQMSLFGLLYFWFKMSNFMSDYWPLFAISLGGLTIRWLSVIKYALLRKVLLKSQPYLSQGYYIPFAMSAMCSVTPGLQFYHGTKITRPLKIAIDCLLSFLYIYVCIRAVIVVPHVTELFLAAIAGLTLFPINLYLLKFNLYRIMIIFFESRKAGKKIQLAGLDFKG